MLTCGENRHCDWNYRMLIPRQSSKFLLVYDMTLCLLFVFTHDIPSFWPAGKQIGQCVSNIMLGFGVKLLCVEPAGEIPDLVERGAKFVELEEVWYVAYALMSCLQHHQLLLSKSRTSFDFSLASQTRG